MLASVLVMTIRCETAEETEEHPEADIPLLTAEQLTRLHSKLDSDGDAKVSLKEILAAPLVVDKAIASEGVKQVFQDLDKSGDGRLSLEEHLADMPQATGEGDGYSPATGGAESQERTRGSKVQGGGRE